MLRYDVYMYGVPVPWYVLPLSNSTDFMVTLTSPSNIRQLITDTIQYGTLLGLKPSA
jgi:hypothetical protein